MQCVEWAFDLSSCYPWPTWRRSRCFRSMGRLQLKQTMAMPFAQPCTGTASPIVESNRRCFGWVLCNQKLWKPSLRTPQFRNSDIGRIVMLRSDLRWLCGGESSRLFQDPSSTVIRTASGCATRNPRKALFRRVIKTRGSKNQPKPPLLFLDVVQIAVYPELASGH